MYEIWSQVDRKIILDATRADLTAEEIAELGNPDDEMFARFVGRLFAAVQAEFDDEPRRLHADTLPPTTGETTGAPGQGPPFTLQLTRNAFR